MTNQVDGGRRKFILNTSTGVAAAVLPLLYLASKNLLAAH